VALSSQISRRKTAFWGLISHYGSVAISLLSGFILLPISLRFIPKDVYGAWLASGNVLAWLTVVDPGLGAIVQQRVAEAFGRKQCSDITSLAWSGLLINSILAVGTIAVGLLARGYLPTLLRLPPEMDVSPILRAFEWAALGTGLSIVAFTVSNIGVGMQATTGIGIPYLCIALASIVLTVLLLYAGLGILAAPIANCFRGGLLLLWTAGYVVVRFRREKIPLMPRFQHTAHLLKLSVYTFVSNGMWTLSSNIDSFLVARLLGPSQVPMFRATRTTVESSRMLVERPFVALMPALSHLAGAGEIGKARALLIRITTMGIWGVVLLGGGFMALNRELVGLWMGADFYCGGLVNLLLCLGLIAGALTSGLTNICFSLGAIAKASKIRAVQAAFQVAGMVGLGWWLGMAGIAAAPLAASILFCGWAVTRLFGGLMDFGRVDYLALGRELIRSVVAASVALGVTRLLNASSWPRLLVAAGLFVACYGTSLYILAPPLRAELSRATTMVRRRLSGGAGRETNSGSVE